MPNASFSLHTGGAAQEIDAGRCRVKRDFEGSGRDFIDSTFNSRGNMEVTRIFAERPRVDRGITQQGKLVRQLTAPSPWRASESPPTSNRQEPRDRQGAKRPSKMQHRWRTGIRPGRDLLFQCVRMPGCPDILKNLLSR